MAVEQRDEPILEVTGLKKYFPIRKGLFKRTVGTVKAVDDVSFSVFRGETLGLVGESGCGKTTTGRSILRLIEPTAGRVLYRHDGTSHDVMSISPPELRAIRRHIQVVFQDPYSSLNPRKTVRDIVAEPLKVQQIGNGSERTDRVADILRDVGLDPNMMNRYPHAFSGGQRQRIGIARSLILRPRLIICDEPVSALDVSVQAQILNLLEDVQERFDLTMVFVAHDLNVVEHISDRVMVMYLGKIVETAPVDVLYGHPLHPYTESLLSAIQPLNPQARRRRITLQGGVPNPAEPPSGCAFHTRCGYVVDRCRVETPELRKIDQTGRQTACHRSEELSLKGIEFGDQGRQPI